MGTPEGIIKARDFKRHPSNGERWNLERFNNFRGVPWATIPGYEQDEIKSNIVLPEPKGQITPPEANLERPIYAPRRIALRQEDVIKAGFTKGCPGCLDMSLCVLYKVQAACFFHGFISRLFAHVL